MVSLVIKKSVSFGRLPEVLLLCVAMVWGASYGLTKSALVYTSVAIFIAIRFGLTFVLLLPLVVKEFINNKNRDWLVALPTGGILACIFLFEVYGVSKTTASNAAFLISLNVIFTALLESLLLERRPSQELICLALLSSVGVFLLTYNRGFDISLNQGDICILAAAALRAVMVTVTKKLTYKKAITNSALTCIQALVVAISGCVIGLAFFELPQFVLPQQMEFWLLTSFLVLFCTLFAFYVQNYAVRKISPTKASLLMGSEPLFGVIFSMLWLGESLASVQWVGAVILLLSVLRASTNGEPQS